ncbi:MAG: DNA ligase D [Acidobacteriota bacterium]
MPRRGQPVASNGLKNRLQEYREKRKFHETPEPVGGPPVPETGPLRFVVQLHRASHLHYDFRLELAGTLKSWAVPKGPSLNPSDKRFAAMVEDHPLDYRTFEGVIPKGNYGAGTVMVWDEGVYCSRTTSDRAASERVLLQGLEKGHITFVLNGRKLKGEFALVKLKKGEPNAWLLLKKSDEFASQENVTEYDRSVVSNRTLDEIAQQALDAGQLWYSRRTRPVLDLSDAPPGEMPQRVRPMLAGTLERPFDRTGWLYEIKWDGYRAIAEVWEERVRLYSRNLLSLEERFPEVVQALLNFGHQAVLDGEVVAIDDSGKPSFQLLQGFRKGGKARLAYYVFDLLYLDGHDLRKLPLRRRKEILEALLRGQTVLLYSDHVEEQGVAFFDLAVKRGLEGIVAKDASSPYHSGQRTTWWYKIKTRRRQEAVIGGFTRPGGGRKRFGALVLGVYEKSRLTYIGHVGSGFDEAALETVHSRLQPLIQKKCPFSMQPPANTPATWVRPILVCDVTFQEWTSEGVMRAPVFVGLRDDKAARSVHRELPTAIKDRATEREQPATVLGRRPACAELKRGQNTFDLAVGDRVVKLTNLNKVYWPAERYTKYDLISYYRAVAQFILPYLKDRPQSLNRHPDGIEGEGFYQKHVENPPDWISTVNVRSDSKRKEIKFLLCQDEATLIYLANLGCIELNPWSSRLGLLDRPDYLVIDLDPEDVPFSEVIRAALCVQEVLTWARAESVCKTSGKTGLHVYVPLGARYSYDQCRQFAEILVHLVHQKLPQSTSLVRQPARRRHKVYLDFLQNRRGQTLAAPYSVRPHPQATVSAPLRWDEVQPGLDPASFTIRTLPERLGRVGDLWQTVLGPGIDIEKCLERLSRGMKK